MFECSPSVSPNSKHVSISTPPRITIYAPPSPRIVSMTAKSTRLTDICEAVRKSRSQRRSLSLRLFTDLLYLPDYEDTNPECRIYKEYSNAVNLGQFLAGTLDNDECQLGYKERTNLALSLASSVLQLNCTQWFTDAWTKADIHFFTKDGRIFDIHSERPSITQTVKNPISDSDGMGQSPDPKKALLELAILLLEIWHHKPLEVWLIERGDETQSSFDGRRSIAIRWLEITQNKLPLNHLKAIEACLQFSAGRLREWEEDDFRKQVCEDVIKPLQENCSIW
jgi:hypothetical protein